MSQQINQQPKWNLSIEPVVKELGNLQTILFSNSEFVASESRFFINEFQSKRENKDSDAMKGLQAQLKRSELLIENFRHSLDTDVQNAVKTCNEINVLIQAQINKFSKFEKERQINIEHLLGSQEAQSEQYLTKIANEREKIDQQFKSERENLLQKFGITNQSVSND
eukprot:TRINITY_DN7739_c0_g1_i1.p1 TRINITY_DN7739_c0_g1~~TRINITY_DN7739_c0_g1_i1.p1  ORF type:complete len:167 (+),score=69.57 TRINITY_DN7739_c0_g1_i1:60-560(+)